MQLRQFDHLRQGQLSGERHRCGMKILPIEKNLRYKSVLAQISIFLDHSVSHDNCSSKRETHGAPRIVSVEYLFRRPEIRCKS